ncbi:MAG: pyrimidine-nucleoside phosphorylase [Lachnospiraceae bacterium]|nr:pyrimidine-nucleoside phosphorylase [Lachnospiraceae bacterium]
MRMYDLIVKKRNGEALTKEEIYWFIEKYTAGEIPDYQVSALMMAIYFRGMDNRETLDLTMAMTYSGDVMDLSEINAVKVDKHSTGGVGDKTSLMLAPLVSSCGVCMAKMSGRGLGHTGGTIDKLEAIPGFNTQIETEVFKELLEKNGIALMGQTLRLAPADKKLYALRDVTGTVENMSLIASSIMSKKLAAGADIIVLDVKTGSGAFMKEYKDSLELATIMRWLGNNAGRKVAAVISDMNQPLGSAVGNALEVKEAIETLKGGGSEQLRELCITLGSLILTLAGKAANEDEAKKLLDEAIESGRAFEKFKDFVRAQGGDVRAVEDTSLLPLAPIIEPVASPVSGYVSLLKCDEVGMCSLVLGGGRAKKEDDIDLSVGLMIEKKISDRVEKGEPLAYIHAADKERLEEARERLLAAYGFSDVQPEKPVLIKEILN